MRKFAYKHTSKEQSSKQSSGSKTETTLILCGYSREWANQKICFQRTIKQSNGSNTETTLILCGYSRERANNRGDRTIKEKVRRRKMRKFAYRQRTENNQADGSKTEATLILSGYSGSRANQFIYTTFYVLLIKLNQETGSHNLNK